MESPAEFKVQHHSQINDRSQLVGRAVVILACSRQMVVRSRFGIKFNLPDLTNWVAKFWVSRPAAWRCQRLWLFVRHFPGIVAAFRILDTGVRWSFERFPSRILTGFAKRGNRQYVRYDHEPAGGLESFWAKLRGFAKHSNSRPPRL